MPPLQTDIKLLIADQHKLLAEALSQALSNESGFSIGIAASLAEISAATSHQAFDIMLVDYTMQGICEIATLGELVSQYAPTRIVLFSTEMDRPTVHRALGVGVCGYIPKTASLDSLSAILRLIAAGEYYVPLSHISAHGSVSVPSTAVDLRLSHTDVEMLHALQTGKSNKDIGRLFGFTEVRVKMMLRSIYTKLNARNRTHVVTIAKEMELI